MCEQDLICLAKTIGRCHSVRSLEYKLVEYQILISKFFIENRIEGLEGICGRYFHDSHRRHIQLEELKILIRNPQDKSHSQEYSDQPMKPFRAAKFKRLETNITIFSEW